MGEFAVAAMGEDRPGIVARVGDALLGSGASIEDSSMTILGGQFAMLLLVQVSVDRDELTGVLQPVADELGLLLEVRPAGRPAGGDERTEHVIAAYGPDRPGLVVALARVLADEGVNISDFGSRVTAGGVFAMWFNVGVPAGVDVEELTERLRRAGGELSLDVTVHAAEAEAL